MLRPRKWDAAFVLHDGVPTQSDFSVCEFPRLSPGATSGTSLGVLESPVGVKSVVSWHLSSAGLFPSFPLNLNLTGTG